MHIHDVHLNCSAFVKEALCLGSCFTDGYYNLENHHVHQRNKFLKIAYQ